MSDLVSPCAKCLLIIINVVFMFASLGIVIFGVFLMGEVNTVSNVGLALGMPFFVIGGLIFIISFFGCCGATQENRCLLITYAITVILLMVVEVAVVVAVLPSLLTMTHTNNEVESIFQVRPSYDTKIYTVFGVLGAIQILGISMSIFMSSQLKAKKTQTASYEQLHNQML